MSLEEIRSNEYNLNIPRYVDSSEPTESFDIHASMFGGIPSSEVEELNKYWETFPNLKNELFNQVNKESYEIKTSNIRETILNSEDVKEYLNIYTKKFSSFTSFLNDVLIKNMEHCEVPSCENIISQEIFNNLEEVKLVDKYEAYQSLDDIYKIISTDLEIIQTEGKEALNQVDPNMIIKKKGDKEEEIQSGWIGHVIPFDLVQNTILKEEKNILKDRENALSEIPSMYEELLEELSEDDKESYNEQLNEDNTAFVLKEVSKVVKSLSKQKSLSNDEKHVLDIFKRAEDLNNQEKTLKKEIKEISSKLEIDTKNTIENLCEEEMEKMLIEKWITPLYNSIIELPKTMIEKFITKVNSISTKYDVTYSQLTNEINETQCSLAKMLNELTGSEHDMNGLNEFMKLLGGE